MSKAYQSTFTGELNTPYSKQFVHSKSSQYRRLKTEWKNNVYLARSRIQGLGLYAAKDLEKHTMVIEYIGTVIRNEVANRREKIYESQVTPHACSHTLSLSLSVYSVSLPISPFLFFHSHLSISLSNYFTLFFPISVCVSLSLSFCLSPSVRPRACVR